jgi:hypothetical protein
MYEVISETPKGKDSHGTYRVLDIAAEAADRIRERVYNPDWERVYVASTIDGVEICEVCGAAAFYCDGDCHEEE